VDCKGLFVTAGFWNSHVHIITPALLHVGDTAAPALQAQLDAMFNRWGFTSVFDLTSVLKNTVALRDRIEHGELRGPRLLTVGEPIWTREPVYVREFLKENHISLSNTKSADEAIRLVRSNAAGGANGIKLFAGSAQGSNQTEVLPLPIATAAVSEAHSRGMPVFAHPNNVQGMRVAIQSGVDVLAHAVPDSPPWDASLVTQLRDSKVALIPSLTLFDVEARRQGLPDASREAFVALVVAQLRAYSQAGGDILFGTDIGYIEQYDTTMEYALMSRAGMNFQQILASLTTTPARRFGYTDRGGHIAPGMEADLVALSADPAQDATALAKVRYTIRKGKITYQSEAPH
jgi:imidazolonepropionase-like amidohydrolase